MVNYYEIRDLDNEEVLILYLNQEYEINNHENISILNKINNYIRGNNIKWHGNKVILVIDKLVLGTIVFGKYNNKSNTFDYIDTVVLNHYNSDNIELGYSKIQPKTPFILDSYSNIIIDDDIAVNVIDSNGEIITIGLEDYVTGVVASEMPISFNMEALKAQAIACRTYALRYLQDNPYLTNNIKTQIYKNPQQLIERWKEDFEAYYKRVKQAVKATKKIVATYNGQLIQSLYYPISNGYTESSYEVFGYTYPYLTVVDSTLDLNTGKYLKEQYLSFDDIAKALKISFNYNTQIEILEKDLSGRITSLKIDNNYFTGTEFRNLLGLRSTDFTYEKVSDGLIFTTKGFGHGVGMSQYGANEMAKKGKTFDQILMHYYPGIKLSLHQ